MATRCSPPGKLRSALFTSETPQQGAGAGEEPGSPYFTFSSEGHVFSIAVTQLRLRRARAGQALCNQGAWLCPIERYLQKQVASWIWPLAVLCQPQAQSPACGIGVETMKEPTHVVAALCAAQLF